MVSFQWFRFVVSGFSTCQNSNASAASFRAGREPSALLALTGKALAHSTDYMIESFWALLENFGLVFKNSPFCTSNVLALGIFLQIDMLTA